MALSDRVDVRTASIGGAGGAGAYLLGYLIIYLTQRGSIEEHLSPFNTVVDLLGGDPIPAWQGIGWLFYNAHFVVTRVPTIGGTTSRNLVANADEGSLTLLYFLPPLSLLGAGYAIASLSDAETPAVAGALAVVGYLPLVILGIVLFSYSVGDGAIEPDAVSAVLLAGTLYPAVFGAIGGAATGKF